jgi:hypothetical protein
MQFQSSSQQGVPSQMQQQLSSLLNPNPNTLQHLHNDSKQHQSVLMQQKGSSNLVSHSAYDDEHMFDAPDERTPQPGSNKPSSADLALALPQTAEQMQEQQ